MLHPDELNTDNPSSLTKSNLSEITTSIVRVASLPQAEAGQTTDQTNPSNLPIISATTVNIETLNTYQYTAGVLVLNSLPKTVNYLAIWEMLKKIIRQKYSNQKTIPFILSGQSTTIENYIEPNLTEYLEHSSKEQSLYETASSRINYICHRSSPASFGSAQSSRLTRPARQSELIEQLYESKSPILLTKLFSSKYHAKQPNEIKSGERYLLLGLSGMGKSILCQYLTIKWACEELWQNFELVLYISLKKLLQTDAVSLGQFILNECIIMQECENISSESIEILIRQFSDKILFILDGYDEVAVLNTNNNKNPATKILHMLLNQKNIIITSRPNFYYENQDFPINKTYVVMGFTQEHIKKYVYNFFQSIIAPDITSDTKISADVYAISLLNYLEKKQPAQGLTHIPINLQILCWVWRDKFNEKNGTIEQVTLTEIYQLLLISLIKNRETTRNIEIQRILRFRTNKDLLNQRDIKYIELLAFESIKQDSLFVISQELVEHCIERICPNDDKERYNCLLAADALGLTKSLDDNLVTSKGCYFIHPMIHAYLAARYLAFHLIENIDFIKKNKYRLRYENLWCFVAGILKDAPDKLNLFFKYMLDEPRDILGFNEQLIMIRCLQECALNIDSTKKQEIIDKIALYLDKCMSIIGLESSARVLIEYLQMSPKVFLEEKIVNVIMNAANISRTKTMIANIIFELPEAKLISILKIIFLKEQDENVIKHYIEVTAKLSDDNALLLLNIIITHSDPGVVSVAIDALKKYPFNKIVPLLKNVINSERISKLSRIVDLIIEQPYETALPLLIDLIKTGSDFIAEKVINYFIGLSFEKIIPIIDCVFNTNHSSEKDKIINVLKKQPLVVSLPIIKKALTSNHSDVKCSMARMLVEIEPDMAISMLKGLLTDANVEVRGEVFISLYKIAPNQINSIYPVKLLGGSSNRLKEIIIRTIMNHPVDAAMCYLSYMSNDAALTIRSAVLIAYLNIFSENAIPMITIMAQNFQNTLVTILYSLTPETRNKNKDLILRATENSNDTVKRVVSQFYTTSNASEYITGNSNPFMSNSTSVSRQSIATIVRKSERKTHFSEGMEKLFNSTDDGFLERFNHFNPEEYTKILNDPPPMAIQKLASILSNHLNGILKIQTLLKFLTDKLSPPFNNEFFEITFIAVKNAIKILMHFNSISSKDADKSKSYNNIRQDHIILFNQLIECILNHSEDKLMIISELLKIANYHEMFAALSKALKNQCAADFMNLVKEFTAKPNTKLKMLGIFILSQQASEDGKAILEKLISDSNEEVQDCALVAFAQVSPMPLLQILHAKIEILNRDTLYCDNRSLKRTTIECLEIICKCDFSSQIFMSLFTFATKYQMIEAEILFVNYCFKNRLSILQDESASYIINRDYLDRYRHNGSNNISHQIDALNKIISNMLIAKEYLSGQNDKSVDRSASYDNYFISKFSSPSTIDDSPIYLSDDPRDPNDELIQEPLTP